MQLCGNMVASRKLNTSMTLLLNFKYILRKKNAKGLFFSPLLGDTFEAVGGGGGQRISLFRLIYFLSNFLKQEISGSHKIQAST